MEQARIGLAAALVVNHGSCVEVAAGEGSRRKGWWRKDAALDHRAATLVLAWFWTVAQPSLSRREILPGVIERATAGVGLAA